MKISRTTVPSTEDRFLPLRRTFGRWLDLLRSYFFGESTNASAARVRFGLGVLLVFALVFIVYSPILPGSFLMDDHRLIKEDNALVNGQFTPSNIWFQTDFTLSTFGLWLQWLAWGENPGWYHAVNILLHGLSAVLLWRLLLWLRIPGAWLVALVFAVHPVCVNSVARIAEIKNTLSLPFFIASFWFYLRYEAIRLNPVRPPARDYAALWFGLSLAAFVLALLSKTSTVMLPPLLLVCAWWRRGRITRQDLLQTSPYFVLALAFGLMSVWFQKHLELASTGQIIQPESIWQKLAVADRVFWFYLKKALWPLNLNIVYPRWTISALTMWVFLPAVLVGAALVFCWRLRFQWSRHVIFGLACFGITLFPVLGFFDSQFLTRWQVSDHLQYLPLIVPVTLAVAGLAAMLPPKYLRQVAVALVVILSVLTFQRAQVFASEEKLMRDTLAKNPSAWAAQDDLGVILAKRQNFSEATECFKAALQANPYDDADKASAHSNLGQVLTIQGKVAEAEAHYLAAIQINPADGEIHKRLAYNLGQQGKIRDELGQLQIALTLRPDIQTRLNLAALLYQTGSLQPAVDQFHKVLLLNPDHVESLNNLAWLLATCPDATLRNGPEAVRHAEHACHLTAYKQTTFISTLAAAYAEAGRFSEAVTTAEMAVKLQTANGERRMAEINNQLLPLYRHHQPFHERPAGQ